jgi:hypothetical protein
MCKPASKQIKNKEMKMNIKITRKIWLSAGITLALVTLTLLVSTAMAQEPVDGTELSPAGGSPTSTMAYQGYLEDDGQPANGAYDFRVNVWNDPVAGSQLGSTQVYDTPGVTVEDGYFTLYFHPGVAANEVFDGGDRWLQLEVRPHGAGGYTTLPRQPITNVPYAWSLRPGAVISGTPAAGQSWVFKVNSGPTTGSAILGTAATGSAIKGQSPGGLGVYGYTEEGYGVFGYDAGASQAHGYGGYFYSSNGIGIFGKSDALPNHPNIYAPGVYGYSTHGSGVYGVNDAASAWTAAGVTGESTDGYGVRGRSINNYGVQGGSVNDHGVYGYSNSSSGAGVYGISDDWVGAYGSGYWGVVGDATGTGSYAGYFYDDLYVGGKIDVGGVVDPIVAERFPADPEQDYESGDVLCLDEASPYVQLCTEENDTKVIGVVAPGPDIEDGEVLITIMGYQAAQPQEGPKALDSAPPRMVMVVKVDASYGSIQRGDLLTSSPTPGYAMKAEPVDIDGVQFYRPGTIIGKAMGSLSEGQGLVEVFVTLQ